MLVLDAEPVFALGAVTALAGRGVPAAVVAVRPGPGTGPVEALVARLAEQVVEHDVQGVLLDAALGEHPFAADVVGALAAAVPGLAIAVTVGPVRRVGLVDVLQAGARALVHRAGPPEELQAGVAAALRGQNWVAGPLAAALRAELRADESAQPLTPREREVLRGLAAGGTNADIGRRLGITAHTVRNHVHSVLAKLDATNRTDAVAIAMRRGLVDLPE